MYGCGNEIASSLPFRSRIEPRSPFTSRSITLWFIPLSSYLVLFNIERSIKRQLIKRAQNPNMTKRKWRLLSSE